MPIGPAIDAGRDRFQNLDAMLVRRLRLRSLSAAWTRPRARLLFWDASIESRLDPLDPQGQYP